MTTAYETYLESVDPVAKPVVRALHKAVVAAFPAFDTKIRYRMLMYAIDDDWGTWVCAVDAGKRHVCLRFLYGVLLEDPKQVLRGGRSVLMNWDLPFNEPIDAAAVRAYVSEAVARKSEYKDNRDQVQAVARRAAERAGRRPKA